MTPSSSFAPASDFTQLKQMQAAVWSAEPERRDEFVQVAQTHFEKGRQPDGSFRDEREYLLITGTRR
jgi:hypothetical protein